MSLFRTSLLVPGSVNGVNVFAGDEGAIDHVTEQARTLHAEG